MNHENLKILIIDDNPQIHKDFIKILKTDFPSHHLSNVEQELFGEKNDPKVSFPKFIINTASQGKEGVKHIQEAVMAGDPYALAFVDIRMPPGWDGIETIKHIWKIDPDVQVVICTAYSDYSWEDTVSELGQRENLLILKKPFDNVSVRQLSMALTKKWQMLKKINLHTKELENKVLERTKDLQYQATHDALTQLPNRKMLADFLHNKINHSEYAIRKFAVLFFDLDRFKLVNDSFNHMVGDELLKLVSERLQQNLKDEDLLARMGGDEFIMVISDIQNIKRVKNTAEDILNNFKTPFEVLEHSLTIFPSIGISIYPNDGKSIEELIRNADMAMYYAKELGGAQYQFYTPQLNQESLKQLEIEADLRKAIDEKQFFLCFQPQVSLYDNKINSVEALIRWRHPRKGIILPLDFIPLAEETGLISNITEWVIKEACRINKAWQDAGCAPIRVAVNITTYEFKRLNLLEMIQKILEETGLHPQYLELELTEKVIISNASAIQKIEQLRDLGISIAIDDFGTGYSSLNYLRKIPLDRLKIDQSFIKNINICRGDEVIIEAIIDMAQNLDLEILAEGVENKKQLEFLKKKHCGEVQGFYFSEPLSSTELETILKKSNTIPPEKT